MAEAKEDPLAKFLPVIYKELRKLAAHYLKSERPGHTLQPTALVHEAYIRLTRNTRIDWQGKTHFLAMAAKEMRRALVSHARAKAAEKRGYEYIVISDHSPSLTVAGGPKTKADVLRKKREIETVQKNVKLKVLCGTEVDIKADGSLDYPDNVLKEFDVIIAAKILKSWSMMKVLRWRQS